MNDSFEKQQIKSLQNSTVSVFLVQGESEPCNFADQVYQFFDLLLVHFFVFQQHKGREACVIETLKTTISQIYRAS